MSRKHKVPSVQEAHRQLVIAEENVRKTEGADPAAFAELSNAYQTYIQSRTTDTDRPSDTAREAPKERTPLLRRLFLGNADKRE